MRNLKHTLLNTFKSYKSNSSGQFAILGSLGLVVVLAGLAVAIDISNGMSQKQRLQNTTDNIALIAVREDVRSQTELDRLAAEYLATTYGAEAQDITLNSIARQGDVVTVNASNNVDTYMSGIFKTNALDVQVQSSATYTKRAAEIALVLDSTGSMRGQKMATLKLAASRLVDTMAETNNSKLRMSVVPFAHYVNVGLANASQSWIEMPRNLQPTAWNGCVGSRNGNRDEVAGFQGTPFPAVASALGTGGSVTCGSEIQPLTRNYGQVKATIQSMVADGWTYMPAGLAWGWRTLTSQQPFAQGLPSDSETDKILILMSDGTNTRSKSGTYHNGTSTPNADRKTADTCTAIKGANIRVITIAYEITNVNTVNLIRNCASTNADFFEARNSDQLENAFDTIAQSLSSLRIAT